MALSRMVPVNRASYRSHEDGDQRSIPLVFFDQRLLDPQAQGDELPFIHQALAVSRQQGFSGPGLNFQQPHLLNVEGRKNTFQNDWRGPCGKKMAAAGFYRTKHDQSKATCAFCHMECKGWKSDEDPWERHKTLSPNCRLVKCAKRMGKKHLCHSYTTLHILTR